MAYVLVAAQRRIGLAYTELAPSIPSWATCATIRPELLKIGAAVTRNVRRIRIVISTACPNAAEFRRAHALLSS